MKSHSKFQSTDLKKKKKKKERNKKHCKKWTSTNGIVHTLPVTVYPEDNEENNSVEVIHVCALTL